MDNIRAADITDSVCCPPVQHVAPYWRIVRLNDVGTDYDWFILRVVSIVVRAVRRRLAGDLFGQRHPHRLCLRLQVGVVIKQNQYQMVLS